MTEGDTLKTAILIPCLNEGKTIKKVVRAFSQQDLSLAIYVCDNGSSDHTAAEAVRGGAHLIEEERQGKGIAVRKMVDEIEADIYVLCDGDDTYSAVDM